MTEPTKVAIVGGGNGAHAMAGHLALKNHQVRLFSAFPDEIRAMQEAGGVHVQGMIEGFGALQEITADPAQAIPWADVIMVVVPAFAHRPLTEAIAPHLRDGQTILLNPGRTGGALEVVAILKRLGVHADVLVGEAQTLIYACRISGPAQVKVLGLKKHVPVAALPATRTPELLRRVVPLFPEYREAQNVLETSLDNIGAVFHPATMVLNANRIEAGDEFDFYRGMTPMVARTLEAVDTERLAVAEAYGVATESAADWLLMAYEGIRGDSLYERIQSNQAYAGIKAPKSLNVRYITEDVPTGLVPIAAFGKAAQVVTRTCEGIIDMCCTLLGRDFWAEGRSLENLGLAGMDREAVLAHVNTGQSS
ncbi:MAG: NADP transhydrogenase subunit alpha [Chloroflexi bacterium]|nr:NADP transhydrogenase subunit alpha [Chloroflexota bacterium]